MLVQDLYYIKQIKSSDGIQAVIEINAVHPIFRGHFPEIPVLPGVCMIQIIKELIEMEEQISTTLKHSDMIKFLSMLNPELSNILDVDIKFKERTSEYIAYNAVIKNEAITIIKNSGQLYFN
jgi:3-hydroxyacyl-[acyl-carrier-protein] dehydratase